MLSLFLSIVAFFVASYYIKRYLDGMDIPKSMTRSIVIFIAASLLSYGVAWIVDRFEPPATRSAVLDSINLQDLLKK